jgi:hypothetical protein
MKSPSDTQNTFTYRTPLSNSMLQAVLSSCSNVVDNTSALPTSTITNTTSSPESKAVRRERLRGILDLALAVIESDDFDFIESSSTTHQWPQE